MFWTSYSHGTHELLEAGTTEQDLYNFKSSNNLEWKEKGLK